jgi:hypothetical protein
MKAYIKSLAATGAILILFAVAIAGTIKNLEPATCTYRAITAAIFAYIFFTIVFQFAARIVAQAMVESRNRPRRSKSN